MVKIKILKMKKHISFPSIEKFGNVIADINRTYNFVGLDESGEAIYDPSKPKPVLTFNGTIKLHGTNAGVSFNMLEGMWAQSRENIITPTSDNAGFAFFVESNKGIFQNLFYDVMTTHKINANENTISIYGEWVGKGIQKSVAISNIDKSFFIFGVKITPHPKDENDKPVAYWIESSNLKYPDSKIFNIEDYKTYTIDIDFNNPQLVQNEIIRMTLEVEDECPVGKAFFVEIMTNNIAYEENGKIWFEKENGFTDLLKNQFKEMFKQLREVNNIGVNYIKFSI